MNFDIYEFYFINNIFVRNASLKIIIIVIIIYVNINYKDGKNRENYLKTFF